jgi:formamidopyrimidine-DNA glycosylase
MPELPEVETVCRTLRGLVVGKTIEDVHVHLGRIIRRPDDSQQFAALLRGQTIRAVERRAKFIRFVLDDVVLLSHLRMEGRYGVCSREEALEKHTHVVFQFTGGSDLRYKDVRQFGTMDIFAHGEEWTNPPLAGLGEEPLGDTFTLARFEQLIKGKSTKAKPFLLNQTHIVGLGNIYVDEALFAAGVHPETPIGKLTKVVRASLHEAIRSTLHSAVELGGSSIKSFVDGQGEMGMFQQQLLIYGRTGEPCVRCGSAIEKTVVGGRGTHTCPKCQPKRKRR